MRQWKVVILFFEVVDEIYACKLHVILQKHLQIVRKHKIITRNHV